MTLDLAKLKEAAERATPGPWRDIRSKAWVARWSQGPSDRTGSVQIARCGDFADGDLVPFNADRWRADAAHIALANPATILALIERLESAEEIVRAFTGDPHIGHIQAARAHLEKHLAKP